MKDGFLQVAAVNMRPGKTIEETANKIISLSKKVASHAKIIVFPELALTGADLRDMFLFEKILKESRAALQSILEGTKSLDALICVGMPVAQDGKVYDCAAVINKGELLAAVPRHNIPSDSAEDLRPFCAGDGNTIFTTPSMPGLTIGVATGWDIYDSAYLNGYHPTLILNPTAVMEGAGRDKRLAISLFELAGRNICAVINVNAGPGGASTDGIYAGGSFIADPEGIAGFMPPYEEGILTAHIDIGAILAARGRDSLFKNSLMTCPKETVFDIKSEETELIGRVSTHPFYPEDVNERADFCQEIFDIQKHALMERMMHIGLKKVVIGVSGGLDSTLALLVAREAIDELSGEKKDLIAVTLPGFGTTDRTHDNATGLIKALGAEFNEIDIRDAVNVHFKDIGQKEGVYDLTFENAQARERTQILMDLAGRKKALMVGTGDMSELALGWCTYNGDHMSMYAVNGGIPKTLIREIVKSYASSGKDKKLADILNDIASTPISPELLPKGEDGKLQKTEDKVGPYELSDFFLYYTLKYGFEECKIKRLAEYAFKDIYSQSEIDKWLKVFFSRFISQSFKRSCSPDGPAVGCGSLSPRTGLRMPSDM